MSFRRITAHNGYRRIALLAVLLLAWHGFAELFHHHFHFPPRVDAAPSIAADQHYRSFVAPQVTQEAAHDPACPFCALGSLHSSVAATPCLFLEQPPGQAYRWPVVSSRAVYPPHTFSVSRAPPFAV